MKSVWWDSANVRRFEPLRENKSCDVLIIGGGITGILCAHMLKRAGVDCLLVEADRICSGITKNTTAKISIAHGLIYDKIIKKYGVERARMYLDAQLAARGEYDKLCREIDCDRESCDAYVYSLKDRDKIEREITALNSLGVSAAFSAARELPMEVAGAVRVSGESHINPLKLLFALSDGLPIYEKTKVRELKPSRAICDGCEISYKKLIVATHFPIINKHGAYFIKMYQHRSYVIALEGAPKFSGMYIDESDGGLSHRSYKELLLLGGGAHRTGKMGGSFTELEAFARTHYPTASVVAKWATQDCMTLDGIPYIGRYSKSTENVFVATGFNKWGMTNAMASAMILTDLVIEKKNEYAEVFSPSRSILHRTLATNLFETTVGLLTPTAPRCPHLGCALKYNPVERSWDCPCHGSRFTENGELIDNPATDDKRK